QGSTLYNYIGTTPTVVDTGLQLNGYVVRNTDKEVFTLHADSSLWAFPGPGHAISGGVSAMVLGADNNLYVMLAGGNLYSLAPGSMSLQYVNGGVQSLLQDSSGTVYHLDSGHLLYDLPAGASAWMQSNRQDVKSI